MLRLGFGLDLPAAGSIASGGPVVVDQTGNLLFDDGAATVWDDGTTGLLWDSAALEVGALAWDDGTLLLWDDGATLLA